LQVKIEDDFSVRHSIAAEEDPLSERHSSSSTPTNYNHAVHNSAVNVVCASAAQQRDTIPPAAALAGYPGLVNSVGQQLQQQQGYPPQLMGHHHPLNPIFHQIQTNWTAMYSHIQQPPQ
jgi:hypothetical protein